MSDYPTEYPVAWHDPFNGDTERLAHDVQAWNEKMHPCPIDVSGDDDE